MRPKRLGPLTDQISKSIQELHRLRLGLGKPKRDDVISKDDITNLKIALNTSESINQLCERI